jgi:hypothetical protein
VNDSVSYNCEIGFQKCAFHVRKKILLLLATSQVVCFVKQARLESGMQTRDENQLG